MTKLQLTTVGLAFALFGGLLFLYTNGAFRPAKKDQVAEPEVVLTMEDLISIARSNLDSAQTATLSGLEAELAAAPDLTEEAIKLEAISSFWNSLQQFTLGGFYAGQIAQLRQTEEAWAIAGTTYSFTVLQPSVSIEERKLSAQQAIDAFDKALEINPENPNHQTNKGLVLVELSQLDASVAPMEGVLLLKGVLEKHPDNLNALYNLGRFSVRSGQYDKAVERFETLVQLDSVPAHIRSEGFYWLAEAYKELGDQDKVVQNFERSIEFAEPGVREKLVEALESYKNQK